MKMNELKPEFGEILILPCHNVCREVSIRHAIHIAQFDSQSDGKDREAKICSKLTDSSTLVSLSGRRKINLYLFFVHLFGWIV